MATLTAIVVVVDPAYEPIMKEFGHLLPIQVPVTEYQESMFWDLFRTLNMYIDIIPRYIDLFVNKRQALALGLNHQEQIENANIRKFDSMAILFRRWLDIMKGNAFAAVGYHPNKTDYALLKTLNRQLENMPPNQQ